MLDTLDTATRTNATHRLLAGPMTLAVDAATGGRIVSLAWDGREVLTPASVHPLCYGSTFWDAPQTAWNWPPRAVLDEAPYEARTVDGTLILTSAVDPDCGLAFTKRFTANAARGRVEIVYSITNKNGHGGVDVGPWEVTRVPGGLSFFPIGAPADLPASALPVTIDDGGVCWYRFDAAELEAGRKLFSTGREGWLAHATEDGLLFVKQFAEVFPDRVAPGQGEIEIWGQDGGIYIELENHGPYTTLKPGETLDYRVNWFLRPLPSQSDPRTLVNTVRELVRAHPLTA